MIVPLVQTQNRYVLNIEDEGDPIAAVEISHVRDALNERERVEVVVSADDDLVIVRTEVKAS